MKTPSLVETLPNMTNMSLRVENSWDIMWFFQYLFRWQPYMLEIVEILWDIKSLPVMCFNYLFRFTCHFWADLDFSNVDLGPPGPWQPLVALVDQVLTAGGNGPECSGARNDGPGKPRWAQGAIDTALENVMALEKNIIYGKSPFLIGKSTING